MGFSGIAECGFAHSLLPCTESESESEIAESVPDSSDSMDCSPPGLYLVLVDFPGKVQGEFDAFSDPIYDGYNVYKLCSFFWIDLTVIWQCQLCLFNVSLFCYILSGIRIATLALFDFHWKSR